MGVKCSQYKWEQEARGLSVEWFHEERENKKYAIKNQDFLDFPHGPVVESPPADAGVIGSILGQGRCHMPQSNQAHVAQLLNLCLTACAPQEKLLPSATRESPYTAVKTKPNQKQNELTQF